MDQQATRSANRIEAHLPVDGNTQRDGLPLAGLRILLAEDGPDNQRLISHVLRRSGADVFVAENGRIAIEKLTTDGTLESSLISPCPFDLLLSDMQMPEMDGYETARWLRNHNSEIPIVALTAHAMSGDLERCTEAGCNAYATKPINKTTLVAICRDWGSNANGVHLMAASSATILK